MTWRPLPGPRATDPRRVGESLDRVTEGLGVARAAALDVVFSRWAEVVGDDVAHHVRPLSLARGRLVLGARDPAWAAQMTWLEADLLARLAGLLGEGVVTAVEVRVRPLRSPRRGSC